MASPLIKRPNATAALQAEVNRLTAANSVLAAQVAECEATAAAAVINAAALEAELACPDCTDLSSLQCEVQAANYDVGKVQGKLRNELCNQHWRIMFNKCGQSAAYKELSTMFEALLLEKEYCLSIAAHNLAFCCAEGAPGKVETSITALETILTDNPDMDARCKSFINEFVAVARA